MRQEKLFVSYLKLYCESLKMTKKLNIPIRQQRLMPNAGILHEVVRKFREFSSVMLLNYIWVSFEKDVRISSIPGIALTIATTLQMHFQIIIL